MIILGCDLLLDNTDELDFEVEFLCCVVDKKNNLVVVDADSHFCEFVGVHPSKVKQGKLSLLDLINPKDRQTIMEKLFKKDSPYVYLNLYIKDNSGKFNYVHCAARNNDKDSLCELTFADVGRSVEKSKKYRDRAKTMKHLIDLVNGGVCLFKVNQDMHFEVLFANEACCRYFGTSKDKFKDREFRIDDLIHPEDKSAAFQAVGVAMATKKPIEMELRVITHDGEYMWCKMDSGIQRYDKDNCPIFHAMFTDITDIKDAEKRVGNERQMLVDIYRKTPGPIFCTEADSPFKLSFVSDDFIKLLGYTRSELFEYYDGDLSKLILPRDFGVAQGVLCGKFDDSDTLKTTYSIKTKSGKYIVVKDRRKIVEINDGRKSMMGILRDITYKSQKDNVEI